VTGKPGQAVQISSLFSILSETTSKTDHAVYEALKDTYVDPAKFPLIFEWFGYVSRFEAKEMDK
jgi:hypothetical protein